MNSRESIPNIGRRAHGRTTLFVLKGNSIVSRLSLPKIERLLSQNTVNCQTYKMGSDTRFTTIKNEEAAVYLTNHPYSRILQRIMRRHGVSQVDCHEGAIHGQDQGPDDGKFAFQDHGVSRRHGESRLAPDEEQTHNPLQVQRHQQNQQRTYCHGDLPRIKSRWFTDKVANEYIFFPSDTIKGTREQTGGVTVPRDSDTIPTRANETRLKSIDRIPKDQSKKRNSCSLEERVDYFWVYQGMGRQVLNINLANDKRKGGPTRHTQSTQLSSLGVQCRKSYSKFETDSTGVVDYRHGREVDISETRFATQHPLISKRAKRGEYSTPVSPITVRASGSSDNVVFSLTNADSHQKRTFQNSTRRRQDTTSESVRDERQVSTCIQSNGKLAVVVKMPLFVFSETSSPDMADICDND